MRQIDEYILGISSRINEYSSMLDNMNMYSNEEENILGISFNNDNIGITSIRIESDRNNNVRINLNGGDLDINFNIENPNSISELLNNISNEVSRMNENLNNLYNLNPNNNN